MEKPSLSELEKRIGYTFHNIYYLECALTHTSYANEQKIRRFEDYERLEFLGDSVLEMVSSVFLYNKYEDKREGELTKIRASLIRLGKGEEAGGGREKDSIVSDVMEAVIGAMYLDSGSAQAPEKFILQFILSDLEGKLLFYDAKSILQESCQKDGASLQYEIIGEEGPGHRKTYTAAAVINGKRAAQGSGRSKKAAEQEAAYHVLLERKKQKA